MRNLRVVDTLSPQSHNAPPTTRQDTSVAQQSVANLGPYELLEPLGQGGMADVWRARTADGDVAAVKLLRSGFSHEVLWREVQLMARLDHPSIVRIRQWGDAQQGEGAALGLSPGTPWIAMDLAEHGSLASHSISSWSSLRRFALQLLDALAYAHARGVIHRDIKPENVLVAGDIDEPRYILTDFGIAFPRTATHERTDEIRYAAAGTLYYMAPEQVLGRWRDFDNFTDLFSLGVVLYEIVAGCVPFTGTSRVHVAMAHPRGMPVIEAPRFGVPAGFSDWLEPMLAFNPSDRYGFAADAIYQLLALHDVEDREPMKRRDTVVSNATTLPLSWVADTLAPAPQATDMPSLRAAHNLGGARTPVMDDWRSTRDAQPAHPMGLKLFGLRRAGIVGREAERDTLWQTLLHTIRSQTAGASVLRGPDGIGCARLMRWLGERAAELGMSAFVRVQRRRGVSALADTLAHELGLVGLNLNDSRVRVAEIFADTDVDVELIALAASGADLPVGDQVHVVREVLAATSFRRPVVVAISEAHDDLEALEYVLAIVGSPLPVLFVLAVNDDALERMPFEAARIDALQEIAHTVVQHIEPLTPQETGRLTDAVNRLGPDEREAVIAQSRGNPLHALQLIELAAAGHDVGSGALADVWRQRVADTLGSMSDEPLLAAAVLGNSVPVELWRRLCRKARVEVPDQFVDRLVRSRLWEVDDYSYRFEHRSLRAALLNTPGRDARLRELHAEAAKLWSEQHLGGQTRRGRHLVAAHRFDEGARHLYAVVNMLLFEGRHTQAQALAHWLRLALDDDDRSQPEAGERLLLMDTLLAQKEGEMQRARELARSVAERAEQQQWWELAAEARRVDSLSSEYLSKPEEALKSALQATDHAERGDDPVLRSRVWNRLGRNHIRAGRLMEARDALQSASETADSSARLQAMIGLSIALTFLGEVDAARDLLTDAVQVAVRIGARVMQGHALNSLAELELQHGNLEAARAHLLDSFPLLRHVYPEYLAQHLLNRAALELVAHDARAADELLRKGLARTQPDSVTAIFGQVLQAVLAAIDGDLGAWQQASDAWTRTTVPGASTAQLWLVAATAWQERGDRARAHAALHAAECALQGVGGALAEQLRNQVAISRSR
jgi:eukaryotic-like serine/threonine-protein kinase